MNKILVSFLFTTSWVSFAQPANDDCASATNITIDAGLTCGETTLNSTQQSGECITNYAGSTEVSVWYTFTANNDSLVLNFVQTNISNLAPLLNVYGPGSSCLPACAEQIYNQIQNGDPGHHILLTGLTPGAQYYIQIQGNQGGGPNDSETDFCIDVASPSTNAYSTSANLIDECGVSFNENTYGGYWSNGTSAGFNNLDGNGTTTCSGCSAGDDTPFVINNVAWNMFCSLTTGTWQITVDGIGNCTLAPPNQGVQASVFTGTTTALVNEGNSPSPISPGGSWTSGVITVNSGECAYLMIDGFAGDVCDYTVTLTNISGGCVLLPLEFVSFNAYRTYSYTTLSWEVASELDNDYFIIEKSTDGINYSAVGQVNSIGNHGNSHTYSFTDTRTEMVDTYYRLSEVDKNGKSTILASKFLRGNFADNIDLMVYPNPADDIINLEFYNHRSDDKGLVKIYSLDGQEVQSLYIPLEPGLNNVTLPINDLDENQYFIKLIIAEDVMVKRFIKK